MATENKPNRHCIQKGGDTMTCQVGTIRQIHQRLNDEGFLISEYTLRQWVKTGRLSAVFVGKKALISFANVLDILNSSQIDTVGHPQSGQNSGT